MTDTKLNVYEGMFLFPQSQSAKLAESIDHIKEILDRSDAQLLAMNKWGEGSLAYPIKKSRRGLYILAYFKSDPARMVSIERDSNLSELILRFMVTRADHYSIEEIQALDRRDAMIAEADTQNDIPDNNEDISEEVIPDDLDITCDSLETSNGFKSTSQDASELSSSVAEPVAEAGTSGLGDDTPLADD